MIADDPELARLKKNDYPIGAKVIFFEPSDPGDVFTSAKIGTVIGRKESWGIRIYQIEPEDDLGHIEGMSNSDLFPYTDKLWQKCIGYNNLLAELSGVYAALLDEGTKARDLE